MASYKFVGEAALTKLIELCHKLTLRPKFVRELPAEGDERYIYFVYNSAATSEKNIFDEYVWVVPTEQGVDPRWELLGQVELDIDLSEYAKKADFDGLKEYVEGLADSITNIEDGEVTAVEVDTKNAPEITAEVSKTATTVKIALTTDLSEYAKASDLSGYAKESELSDYAKKSDLNDYATIESLSSAVADVESKIPEIEEITADDVQSIWDSLED